MLERLLCAVLGHRYVAVERVLNHGAGRSAVRAATAIGRCAMAPDLCPVGRRVRFYAPGGILAQGHFTALPLPPNAGRVTHREGARTSAAGARSG